MIRIVLSVLCLAVLAACSKGTGKIEGAASYRERIALPADAVFEAELLDLSAEPPRVIASSGIQAVGAVPFTFAIAYRKNQIDRARRYGVRAEIRSQARTVFATQAPVPVLTQGHGRSLDLVLGLVATSADVAQIARTVIEIENKIASLERIEGVLSEASGPPLNWIAFVEDGAPVKIIVQQADEFGTSQAASFHFANGQIVHCASDSQIPADPSAGLAGDLDLSFDLYFKDGRFAGGTKTANGVVGEPDEHEVRALGGEGLRVKAAVIETLGGK